MEPCPYCGFVNRPNAVRCECCLSPLAAGAQPDMFPVAGEPARAPTSSSPASFAAAPAGVPAQASQRGRPAAEASPHAPLFAEPRAVATEPPPIIAQPPPIEPGGQLTGVPSRAPSIGPHIGGGSTVLVVVLMIVGVIGGAWFLRPKGRPALLQRLVESTRQIAQFRKSPVEASRKPGEAPGQAAPVTLPAPGAQAPIRPGASAAPAAAPAAPPRSASPATAPAPAASRAEDEAEARLQVATRMLDRKQTRQARALLQELMQRYPTTQAAAQARDLLPQIPDEPSPPPARPAASSRVAVAPAPVAAPPAQPRTPPAAKREDPISEALAGRSRPTAQRPIIPDSLRGGQPGQPTAGVAAGPDEVRVLSAAYQGNALVVEVEYTLRSAHARAVFLGAWMRSESVSGRLGYTFAPVNGGRGSARLVLSGIPANVSSLRLTLFEEKGDLFFTKDFMISR